MTNSVSLNVLSAALADLVARVGAAVVSVRPRGVRPTSGTVVAPDRVLAVDHTLPDDAEIVIAVADGRQIHGEVAGRDPQTDLALIRVTGLGLAPLADAPAVSVGQLTVAVGRGSSGALVAGAGVIGAVGASLHGGRGGRLDDLLVTRAGPFRGFSGAAIVDADARLVGLGNAGLVRGTGLVVPADRARRVAESLDRHGHVRQGYLGVGGQPVRLPASQRAGGSEESGLLVVSVAEEGPAARAGLHVGDVIIGFAGQRVRDAGDLVALLGEERVGVTYTADLVRAGERRTLQVTVGERPAP